MLHWMAWLVARILYRIRVLGAGNVPLTGPVLLLSNHVTYIDSLIIQAACPRRVYFLIDSQFVNKRWYGFVLRLFSVITIDRKLSPKSLRESFREVESNLREGKVICIFPEGAPTRTGVMLPFKRGFELVAKSSSAAIVPMYLDRLWGSRFSYASGKVFSWKSSRRDMPVCVAIGPAMPSDTSAAAVRQAINELSTKTAIEIRSLTLAPHRQFVRVAAKHASRLSLIDQNSDPVRKLTAGQVLTGAICLSRAIRAKVASQEMVGLWLPSSVGGALANVAVGLLGKTTVNLNYTAGPSAVQSAAKQCDLRVVLSSKRFLARMPLDLPGVEIIALEDIMAGISDAEKRNTYLKIRVLPVWALEWLLGLKGKGHSPDDVATVIFSSGSTGEPKGIMLTHGNIATNVEGIMEYINLSDKDRVLGILPFFHSFGYTVTLWGALMSGASAVYHPDPRAAKEVGELCKTYACTLMGATATFLRLYLRRCQPDDFKSMRFLVCGAEKLPPELIHEFRDKFGIQPMEGYGCTELSPVVSVNIFDATVNGICQVGCKIGSIGHTLPGIAIRIADPDSLQLKPIGEDGLVLVAGPNVMKGYLKRDDLTRKAMVGEWYNTGDVGRQDADGFVTLTGRLSRFAKIGGEMVPLELLEQTLHGILKTTDRYLAAVAIPDPKRGEKIVLVHLPLQGMSLEDLLKELSKTGLPNLWQPDLRDAVAVSELPILGSGKLDLQALKQIAQEKQPGVSKA